MRQIKYLIGVLLAIPMLPFLYMQGKRIRKTMPQLPEAKGLTGLASVQSNQADRRTKTLRLLALGESTIAGVGVTQHEEGFTGTLAKKLAERLGADIDWQVSAQSGYTAKQVRTRIFPKVESTNLDFIAIGLGANDAFTANYPTRWRGHIEDLLQDIRQKYPKTPIFFINMAPIKEFPIFTPLIKFFIGNLIEILGKELEDLVKNHPNVYYNAEIITFDSWVTRVNGQANKADFFSDGVHPSRLTYQLWAADFAEFILQNNKEK